jgi:hypothetical protein
MMAGDVRGPHPASPKDRSLGMAVQSLIAPGRLRETARSRAHSIYDDPRIQQIACCERVTHRGLHTEDSRKERNECEYGFDAITFTTRNPP